MLDSVKLLDYITKKPRVILSAELMAKDLHIDLGDPHAMGELEFAIRCLEDEGKVTRWKNSKDVSVVTMTAETARAHGLKLSESSSRWIDANKREKPAKVRTRPTESGVRVICESDMSEEPPGRLANIPDPKSEINQDPDEGLLDILAEERALGLIRPTLALVGIKPWTAENHERAPDAHKCDPRDDPRADPGVKVDRRKKQPIGPCPVCNGRPMRAMVALTPVRVGKNRAMRPPAVVDGGECCARCGNHWQDATWPKVYALPAGEPGKKGAVK